MTPHPEKRIESGRLNKSRRGRNWTTCPPPKQGCRGFESFRSHAGSPSRSTAPRRQPKRSRLLSLEGSLALPSLLPSCYQVVTFLLLETVVDTVTSPRITIDLASHERRQLDDFIPRILDHHDIGDEEAEEIEAATLIDNEDGTYSATVQEWAAIISGLRLLRDEESLRTWWLRKKLAKRLRDAEPETLSEDVTPGVEAGETTTQDGVSA